MSIKVSYFCLELNIFLILIQFHVFLQDLLHGILLSLSLFLHASSAQNIANKASNRRAVFDVTKFGAKGNGKTLDYQVKIFVKYFLNRVVIFII